MKKRISDLMDCIHDADYELNQETPLSSQRIKELTMNKITNKRKSRHIGFRVLVAAAVIAALTATVFAAGNVAGWFREYFEKQNGEPLTPGQIEFIEENEQIVAESHAVNGWSVEMKSAITDGETGYILFSVTSPETIDLEDNLGRDILDGDFITPGNESFNNHIKRRRTLCLPSTGPASEEMNYIWNSHSYWEADNDGLANTLNYMIEIQCQKLYPERECLLEAPFGSDITFNVRFIDFTYEYEDPEIRRALDEKYAGQDNYLIDGEEMKDLRKSEVLVEGEWEFNINFGMDTTENIELISDPVTVEARVYRKNENGTMFFDTTEKLEQVKLTSFRLTAFGAQLMFEEDEGMIGVFVEYQNVYGYEDHCVFVVMEDGSRIALHTDGTGTVLAADSPIVLDEVDHILLADGTKIMVP